MVPDIVVASLNVSNSADAIGGERCNHKNQRSRFYSDVNKCLMLIMLLTRVFSNLLDALNVWLGLGHSAF